MQNFQKYNTTRTVRRKEAQLSIQKNAYILRSGREEKVFFLNTHAWALPITSWIPIHTFFLRITELNLQDFNILWHLRSNAFFL